VKTALLSVQTELLLDVARQDEHAGLQTWKPATQIFVPRLRNNRGWLVAQNATRDGPLPTWETWDGHQIGTEVRKFFGQFAQRRTAIVSSESRAAEWRDQDAAIFESTENRVSKTRHMKDIAGGVGQFTRVDNNDIELMWAIAQITVRVINH
jgi:hypothetical protein